MRWHSAALALLLASAPALAESPRQQYERAQKELAASKSHEAGLKQQLTTTTSQLQDLRDRSTELADKLQASERRTDEEEDRYTRVNGELAAKQAELASRSQEYADTIGSLLRMQSLPTTALFAKPDDVHQLMRSASVLQNTNEAVAKRAEQLKTELARITDLRQQVAKSREKVSAEQLLLRKDQQALALELAKRQAAQQKLSSDHAVAEAKVGELSRESASLSDLIGKIEKNRDRPLFGPARTATSDVNGSPLKGRLKLPVVGKLIHSFGEHKNANESYRGIVLSARSGGAVVAPYGGEVVFTGPFMDYGRMVLLKHPDGYISLLAGLGTISVTLNQSVAAGEPLGTMGNTAAPSLYVELRERSKPIDPAGWFANLGSRVAQR